MKSGRTGYAVVLLSLLAALFLLLSTACGDDDGDDDGGDGAPTAAATPTGGGDEGDGDDGGGDLSDRLTDLGTDWGNVSGRITYEMTDPQSGTVTLTLYQDPPGRSRMDILGEDDEGGVIIITTTEASYFCSGSGDEGICFEAPAEEGTVPSFFADFSDPDSFSGLDLLRLALDSFDEKIAGVDASCFRATGGGLYLGGTGKATWCFSANGLLLRSAFEGDAGSFSMEATEVGDVSDADFEPPYTVQDFGG